jgi:hypothetical protein
MLIVEADIAGVCQQLPWMIVNDPARRGSCLYHCPFYSLQLALVTNMRSDPC